MLPVLSNNLCITLYTSHVKLILTKTPHTSAYNGVIKLSQHTELQCTHARAKVDKVNVFIYLQLT